MTRRPPPKARTAREHEERFEVDPDDALDRWEELHATEADRRNDEDRDQPPSRGARRT